MEDRHWLNATNEFGILTLKFLYFSNLGAIIAILVNINNFVDEEDYPAIAWTMSLFIWGLLLALVSTLFGYFMHRALLVAAQSSRASNWERFLGGISICAAIGSFFLFALGAHHSITIIESAM